MRAFQSSTVMSSGTSSAAAEYSEKGAADPGAGIDGAKDIAAAQ